MCGGDAGSGAQDAAVSDAILRDCREHKRCAIIVNQMDKQGELKGGTGAAHNVDTVLVFAFPKGNEEDLPEDEENLRVLLCDGKNRNGAENAKVYWRMTAEGRLEHVPPRSKVVLDFPTKRYGKRD